MKDLLMQLLKEMGFVFAVIAFGALLVFPFAATLSMTKNGGSWLWVVGAILYLVVTIGVALVAIDRLEL